MKIMDLSTLKKGQDYETEGIVQIDYIDPTFGKVRERIRGKNHVFDDALFMTKNLQGFWYSTEGIDYGCLMMTDSEDNVDPDFPYITGGLLGYGYHTQGSSGTLKGAWNPGGYLGNKDLSKIEWKFIYDFTPTQALGSIKTIGLTRQNATAIGVRAGYHLSGAPSFGVDANYKVMYNNKMFTCSTSGVVTIHDLVTGATTTKDISAIVGVNTSDNKSVGVDPVTGEFYILVTSATSTRRYLYKFSDESFGTLLATLAVSALTLNSTTLRFYVNGGRAFAIISATPYVWDFTANTVQTAFVMPSATEAYTALGNAIGGVATSSNIVQEVCIGSKLICVSTSSTSGTTNNAPIIDLTTMSWCGWHTCSAGDSSGNLRVFHPKAANKLLYVTANPGSIHEISKSMHAHTRYKLPVDAPERPAGYGMTVTYELKVNW